MLWLCVCLSVCLSAEHLVICAQQGLGRYWSTCQSPALIIYILPFCSSSWSNVTSSLALPSLPLLWHFWPLTNQDGDTLKRGTAANEARAAMSPSGAGQQSTCRRMSLTGCCWSKPSRAIRTTSFLAAPWCHGLPACMLITPGLPLHRQDWPVSPVVPLSAQVHPRIAFDPQGYSSPMELSLDPMMMLVSLFLLVAAVLF